MRVLSQRTADSALNATARFWFVVTVCGQLLFAFTIASYYGLTAIRGDVGAWNRRMMHGWVAGDRVGNAVVMAHLASAVIIILAGAIQFVPLIRKRFPAFHRWNGRIYVLTAVSLTTAGLYMQWIRKSFGDVTLSIGSTFNVVLIWLCAAMAVRYAIARDFETHRRWTLRLFLVVSAAWFFRAAFYLSIAVFKGPFGFDPKTFSGPFITFMAFAQYLIPLAVLELYFRAKARPGALRRFAMAAALLALTVVLGAGVTAVSAMAWVPSIKAAFNTRTSLRHTLATAITAIGIDGALHQIRQLKAADPATYDFDEDQLNTLVAESYLEIGNRLQAIAHYRKALQINPNNRIAAAALRKLGAI